MTLHATAAEGLRARLATPEADADDLDTRILDAALAEFETYGLRRVSVEDVAKRAGVARTTIYRRFTNKEQLLQAVILRECRRFLTAIAEATENLASPEDAVVEGFVVGLQSARTHPLMTRVLESEPEAGIPQLSMTGGAGMLAPRDIPADRLGGPGPGERRATKPGAGGCRGSAGRRPSAPAGGSHWTTRRRSARSPATTSPACCAPAEGVPSPARVPYPPLDRTSF